MKVSKLTIKHLSIIINGDCGYTPYLSGPNLVELFNRHGFRDVYESGLPSRWFYVEGNMKKLNGSLVGEKRGQVSTFDITLFR